MKLPSFLQSRIFEKPRKWSNNELKKFAHYFDGDVVNVSGWKDSDKEGSFYKNYFVNSNSYTITNFESDKKGFQGYENEVFLDLEKKIAPKLVEKFDVVYNHTTLEHVYEFRHAFKNICLMSRDVVILVVPFLQQMHASYGDYWRFTPLSIKKLFEENGLKVLYSSFNEDSNTSVYLFFIASKHPKKWKNKIHNKFNYKVKVKYLLNISEPFVGSGSIRDNALQFIFKALRLIFNKKY